jgi:hypothetical protein
MQLRQPSAVDDFSHVQQQYLAAEFGKQVGSLPGGLDGTGRRHQGGQSTKQQPLYPFMPSQVKTNVTV